MLMYQDGADRQTVGDHPGLAGEGAEPPAPYPVPIAAKPNPGPPLPIDR
jgi:hypothetical protein